MINGPILKGIYVCMHVGEVKCVCVCVFFSQEYQIRIRLSRDLSIYYMLRIYYEATAYLFCECRQDNKYSIVSVISYTML